MQLSIRKVEEVNHHWWEVSTRSFWWPFWVPLDGFCTLFQAQEFVQRMEKAKKKRIKYRILF